MKTKSPNQVPAASSTAYCPESSSVSSEILYITKPIPLTTTSRENSNVNVLKVEEFYGHPPLNLDRIKLTNIISADSIRRNRNQSSKINQISDIKKIPFTLTEDDNEKENLNAQSDTMSVTDSVLEYLENEYDRNSSSHIVQNTMKTKSTGSINYLSVDNEYPRNISSPAKSLNQQFSSMKIDQQQSPKQQQHQFPTSPAKSFDQKCSIGSSPISNISSSTDRYVRPSPSPSKMKYLQQPIRSRSRSVSPKLLSQYQTSECISSTSSLSSSGDHFGIKSSHGELSWGSTKLRKMVKKTFTIKNIAHRKTSVKFDIIGPGFQVNILRHKANKNVCHKYFFLFKFSRYLTMNEKSYYNQVNVAR